MLVDLDRRDAQRLHASWVELDTDLAIDSATAGDLGHASNRQKALRHGIVDEPGELLVRQFRGAHAEVGNCAAVDVDTTHLRLQDSFGQLRADFRDRVTHVRHRAIDGRADLELDEDVGVALNGERVDVVDVADARDSSLDLLDDLGLDLLRRRPWIGDVHRDEGECDVRIQCDRQAHERYGAREDQHDEQHDGRDRMLDRPSGNIPHDGPAF